MTSATTTVSSDAPAAPAGTAPASTDTPLSTPSAGQNSPLKWVLGGLALLVIFGVLWFLVKPGLPADMGGSPSTAAPVTGILVPPRTVNSVPGGKQVNHLPGMTLITYTGTPVQVICDPDVNSGIAYSSLGGVASTDRACKYPTEASLEAKALADAAKAAADAKTLADAAALVAKAKADADAKTAADAQAATIAAAVKAALDAQKTSATPAKVSHARPAAKPTVSCPPCAAKAA